MRTFVFALLFGYSSACATLPGGANVPLVNGKGKEITEAIENLLPPGLAKPEVNIPDVLTGGVPGGGGGLVPLPFGKKKCFHKDSTIMLQNGERKIAQLAVGDKLWSKDGTNRVTELEKLPEFECKFVRITTADGDYFAVTPEHLILTKTCGQTDSNWQLRPAEVARVGECVPALIGQRQTERPIRSVQVFSDKGVYRVITESGTIIAGNVTVSCYDDHEIGIFKTGFYGFFDLWKVMTNFMAMATYQLNKN